VLANITRNRCTLVENSNTCRCVDDVMGPKPSTVVSTAPDVMFSEVLLIFFVLGIWLSAIGFCFHQYKSLRRLETQVHYCVNRKDPLNIGEIKIVSREQDSIIYKKKRYSTVVDTHVNNEDLKNMHYVKEYLPQSNALLSSATHSLVIDRQDLVAHIPLTVPSTISHPLSTHDEVSEEQATTPTVVTPLSFISASSLEIESNRNPRRISYAQQPESARLSVGLTVPHVSNASSLNSSWNSSQVSENSCSAQHLSVPTNGLRSNRYSDGNIFSIRPSNSDQKTEELIDPRLISDTVRRSLLALHRESQENISMNNRSKENTQSENDVHGAFTPWKIKMKSKLKRTHHRQTPRQPEQTPSNRSQTRANSILPVRFYSNDHERRVSAYATMNHEQRFSTPPTRNSSISITPTYGRSLKYYPKYSTQSTTESETAQSELPKITSIFVSVDDEDSVATVVDKDVKTSR